jgi:Icc-related predicted phosphoesterase
MLHVFGHVHGARGIFQTSQTTFANAALLGSDGDLNRRPILLKMVAL